MIRGAGNVTGHAIDRLDLAAEALGRARVHEPPRLVRAQRVDPRGVDHHVGTHRGRERPRAARFDPASSVAPFRRPFRKPAIEHRDRVVSEPAQHPPEPARVSAVVLVVRDDLDPVGNAHPAEGVYKCNWIR